MESDTRGWSAAMDCRFWFLLVSTFVMVAVGAGMFVAFAVAAHNYHAAMWSLSAAIFSAAGFHLHLLNLLHRLSVWHDRNSLNQVKYLALMVCCLSTVGGAVYGVLAYKGKQEIEFGENNFVLSLCAAGFSLAAGFLLFFTAKFYRHELLEIPPQRIEEETGGSSFS